MDAGELKRASRERLAQDLKNIVTDVNLYLSASGGEAGEAYDAGLEKLKTTLDAARAHIAGAQRGIAEKTRVATQATDAYVHENAWKAVAVAAGLGLIAGYLVARR
jgi:ElaB/YqjD/DUF883 family membrane-anchored ribosome-binding protein